MPGWGGWLRDPGVGVSGGAACHSRPAHLSGPVCSRSSLCRLFPAAPCASPVAVADRISSHMEVPRLRCSNQDLLEPSALPATGWKILLLALVPHGLPWLLGPSSLWPHPSPEDLKKISLP